MVPLDDLISRAKEEFDRGCREEFSLSEQDTDPIDLMDESIDHAMSILTLEDVKDLGRSYAWLADYSGPCDTDFPEFEWTDAVFRGLEIWLYDALWHTWDNRLRTTFRALVRVEPTGISISIGYVPTSTQ